MSLLDRLVAIDKRIMFKNGRPRFAAYGWWAQVFEEVDALKSRVAQLEAEVADLRSSQAKERKPATP